MRLSVKISAMLFCVLSPIAASACDVKYLPFGSSIDEVAGRYKLNTLGATPDKESEILTRGSAFCSELPKDSIAIFTFIYGELVQLRLERSDSRDTLLAFAKDNFTLPEDADMTKPSLLFDVDNMTRSVIYKSEADAKGKPEEVLAITSRKHDELFKRIADAEKKNIVKD